MKKIQTILMSLMLISTMAFSNICDSITVGGIHSKQVTLSGSQTYVFTSCHIGDTITIPSSVAGLLGSYNWGGLDSNYDNVSVVKAPYSNTFELYYGGGSYGSGDCPMIIYKYASFNITTVDTVTYILNTSAITDPLATFSWNFGRGLSDTSTSRYPNVRYSLSDTFYNSPTITVTLIVTDTAGCSDTATASIFYDPNRSIDTVKYIVIGASPIFPTGISTDITTKVCVFPNPATNNINIPAEHVNIYNVDGQEVYDGKGGVVSISNFSSGLYYVTADYLSYSKFIKQ